MWHGAGVVWRGVFCVWHLALAPLIPPTAIVAGFFSLLNKFFRPGWLTFIPASAASKTGDAAYPVLLPLYLRPFCLDPT